MPVFNVFNYSDHADDDALRDIVCSNPISEIAASCAASNPVLTFPRIRNNSAYEMDVDSIRNTLESMAPTVLGDLAAMHEIRIRPRPYPYDVLRKLEDDYRRWEVERIKKLISSKATIRYRIEVK
jgi:hypothetical protein